MSQSAASSQAGKSWHIFTNGEVKGPFPQEEVLRLIDAGQIAPDAQFNCDGQWLSREAFTLACDELSILDLEPSAVIQPPPMVQPTLSLVESQSASEATETPAVAVPDVSPPVRDRIVVIGRRAAGKTIYLAELYNLLWKSRDGLCMKALSGRSHKELIAVHETMRQGRWPAATDRTTILQMEFELTYRGRPRVLVGLDYAGEVFRDAFVNDDVESPQAKALISHIDRAMAVILLIDPSIAVRGDSDAQIDDDFGIVQAVQRIRDWPGGEDVPIVLLLTKADQNRALFADKRSTRLFIETHYPALVRTLKTFKAFNISAVQADHNAQGNLVPRRDSMPVNVLESLKYCLDVLETRHEREQIVEQQRAEEEAFERMVQLQVEAEHQSNLKFALLIASILTIGACIIVLIVVFRG